jgi:hypothetical protein
MKQKRLYSKEDLKNVWDMITGLDLDKNWIIQAKQDRAKLSDRQRRYYFGVVIPAIMSYTGYSKDEMHEYCKNRFLLPIEKKILEKHIKYIPSITKLNTKEMSEYITKIMKWSSRDLGVYIPEPSDFGLDNK